VLYIMDAIVCQRGRASQAEGSKVNVSQNWPFIIDWYYNIAISSSY
jgi:hypothetical protein